MRLLAILLYAMAAFCVFMFHQNYWRFRHLFDQNGRHFDPDSGIVYFSQAGAGWGAVALLCFLLGFWLWPGRNKRPDHRE